VERRVSEALILSETDARGVATVTLNRPDVHNAFNDAVIRELAETLERIAADEKVRVLVLEGAGKSFSAGADLKWMKAAIDNTEAENEASAAEMAALFHRLDSMPVPTIARVQGSAFAGGLGIVVCCDIAIGVLEAKFAVTEVKLGLIPAVISPYLTAAIGPGAARRYFHTAEVFDAVEAKRIGVLHDAVPAEQLDERIAETVEAILGNAPEANVACKALIRDLASLADPDTRKDTSRRIAAIRATPEAQEGIGSFFEKRAPNWAGKGTS
jgi:methylglutaconyl-CoA hydratase